MDYFSVSWEYILFRDVEHSGTGYAPESVPTNSYHTRNQLPLIPTDSRNRLHFRPIPRCINSRNSRRFRFQSIPEFRELIPRAELILQCSTLRNRMTAQFPLNFLFSQIPHWIILRLAITGSHTSIRMVRQFIDIVHNQWDQFKIFKFCYKNFWSPLFLRRVEPDSS